MQINQCDTPHQQKKGQKPHDHSIGSEKALDKIQHPFMIKTYQTKHRGNLPQYNKGRIWQTHSQHRSQWWKIETISTEIRNKIRLPTFTTVIQHILEVLPTAIREEKEIKGIQIRKEEVKLTLVCRWQDTIHRES